MKTSSSAKHAKVEQDERYPLAFPAPPVKESGEAVPAFPPPPPPPVTPATRAFPLPPSGVVRFGEQVLRDERAGDAAAARFDVDLRQREAPPAELSAAARKAAEATGYSAGWAQGRRESQTAAQSAADRAADAARDAAVSQRRRVEVALAALANAATNLERRAIPAMTD